MSTENAIEVKKDGLRQCQDGTWKLSVTVHPNDMPTSLMSAPMGTRYGMALVEINDDETPKAPEKPARKPAATRTRSQWAWIRCNDSVWRDRFGLHPDDNAEEAAAALRQHLGIQSRKELDSNPAKAAAWDKLDASFMQDTGRMAEKHG